MQARSHQPLVGPCVWKGAELQRSTEWLRRFEAHELAEIDAALAQVKRGGLEAPDITREDFPLPTFARELAKISTELESGRGMIMLRGLPLTYSEDELRTVYWGIGTHLGTPLSQNAAGELLGIVKDFGPVANTKRRGSKTADGLEFHSDRCDVVGLLCVRKARSGGESRILSAAALHNEVLRRRPDLIEVFYSDFHHSWQGEEPPGQGRAYTRPIFGFRDGYFTGLFSPAYIRFAQEYEEVPRLTKAQSEALDLFTQLAEELALSMNFEPRRHPAPQQPRYLPRAHPVRGLSRGVEKAPAPAPVAVGARQPASAQGRRLRSRAGRYRAGRDPRRGAMPRRLVARGRRIPRTPQAVSPGEPAGVNGHLS